MQFEPGTRWDYGIGIDCLGRVIEKVDGRRINRFLRGEIFDPLDMPDTRFEVEPNVAARLSSVSILRRRRSFRTSPLRYLAS